MAVFFAAEHESFKPTLDRFFYRPPLAAALSSCFKTPQLARYGVIKRFEMLIDSPVNCAFSAIYAWSRTHLRGFTADFSLIDLSMSRVSK